MFNKILIFSLLISLVLIGCDNNDDDDNSQAYVRPPRAIATLSIPSAEDLIATQTVPHTFTVRVSGVPGLLGAFSGEILNTTGTVDVTDLTVSFGPLVQIGELGNYTFESVGTVSGPFEGEGTVNMSVSYFETGIEVFSNTLEFSITVPPFNTSVSFSPSSPLEIGVTSSDVVVTAVGSPAGGTISIGNSSSGGTGGSFIAGPGADQFTFTGATANQAGTATAEITYIPAGLEPSVTVTYSVIVSGLSFSTGSTANFVVGDGPITVVATGLPGGGLLSLSNIDDGGTGGAFTLVSEEDGIFTFAGALTGGTATVDVTYSLPTGSGVDITRTYTVNVTSMVFSPVGPINTGLNTSVTVTAMGLPSGGAYSGGGFIDPATGGEVTEVDPVLGTFTFQNANNGGTATIDITFTPLVGAPITQTYNIRTSGVSFSPNSPINVVADSVGGSAPVTFQALGTPAGGSFAVGAGGTTLGAPGGVFTGPDPITGEVTFAGATAGGVSTIDLEYTPPVGATVSRTYTVNASGMTISPASPLSVVAGDPDIVITATGTEAGSGGVYAFGATTPGGTGGFFTNLNTLTGTFEFTTSTAVSAGTETIEVIYSPQVGADVALLYTINVSNAFFSPAGPATLALGSSTVVSFTAFGSPGTGTFTQVFNTAATGGSFSVVGTTTSSRSYTYSGPTGVGAATATVTYTPLVGAPVTFTYTINVVPTIGFLSDNPLQITTQSGPIVIAAQGLPAGGTYALGSVTDSAPPTGGSFSGIDPVAGSFTFSGASAAGFASVEVLYTAPGASAPISAIYTVNVTHMVFEVMGAVVEPPIVAILAGETISATAIGMPPGGSVFITGSDTSVTGGTFVPGPGPDDFTFMGSTTGGTATVDITYIALPPFAPMTRTFFVNVTSLMFDPPSPGATNTNSLPFTFEAIGLPVIGTLSIPTQSGGGTGGTFSVTGAPGDTTVTFDGATTGGTASADITFTPATPGFLPITLPYEVNVTHLDFSTANPLAILADTSTGPIVATGIGGGPVGEIRFVVDDFGGTGGTFTFPPNPGPNPATFSYIAPLGGTVTVDVTYTPSDPTFIPITTTFTILVTSLDFTPDTPLALTTLDGPTMVDADGLPVGGVYSAAIDAGSTDAVGLTFSGIDPSTGVFTVDPSTVTTGGTTVIDVTYTPDPPNTGFIPITLPYSVLVTHMTFTPPSPSFVGIASTTMVDADGTPTGGTYSISASDTSITGGTFSIDAVTGVVTFDAPTAGGDATVDVTYTPDPPNTDFIPITLTYTFTVVDIVFSPDTPLGLTAEPTSMASTTVTGVPAGGTLMVGASTNTSGGTLTFTPGGTPETGTLTLDAPTTGAVVTQTFSYDPDGGGPAPTVMATFTFNVTSLSFGAAAPAALIAGTSTTVSGNTPFPAAGTFSISGTAPAGGSFSIDPVTGDFTLDATGVTTAVGGTYTATVTFTPTDPDFVPISLDYDFVLTTLNFSPTTPTAGFNTAFGSTTGTTTVTLTGLPGGGAFSDGGSFADGATGLTYTPSLGTGSFDVDFSTVTAGGTATVSITYTPGAPALPITLTYTINCTFLDFDTASPIGVPATVTTPEVTASGTGGGPGAISFSTSAGTTGGTFDTDTGAGTFRLLTPPMGGVATVTVTYTPTDTAFVAASDTFTFNVTSLTFSPASPASAVIGGMDPITITATGFDGTGTIAYGSSVDMVITGVMDGTLPGGSPKVVEVFIINDIPDLSDYGLGVANNGGGTDGVEYTFPAIAGTAGSFFYVTDDGGDFTSFFGFAADDVDGAITQNGDDTIELFKDVGGTPVVVDTFGEINVDGTGEPWEYMDGWASRLSGSGPDGNNFTLANWTFSGPDALDGETTNAGAAVPFPVGAYLTTADTTGGGAFTAGGGTSPDSFMYGGFTADGTSRICIVYTPATAGFVPTSLVYEVDVTIPPITVLPFMHDFSIDGMGAFTNRAVDTDPACLPADPVLDWSVTAGRADSTGGVGSYGNYAGGVSVLRTAPILTSALGGMDTQVIITLTHEYDFEAGFDGGLVAIFTDVDPTLIPIGTGQGVYDGTLAGGGCSSFDTIAPPYVAGTTEAFNGSSGGVVTETLSFPVSMVSGATSFTIAFLASSETFNAAVFTGWRIDSLTIDGVALTVCSGPIAVPFGSAGGSGDPDMIMDSLVVEPAVPPVTELRVLVDMSHTFIGDVVVTVMSPTFTTISLVANEGGSGDDLGVIFDDDAATGIDDGGFTGTPGNPIPFPDFMPEASPGIGSFIGADPSGVWTLTVIDTSSVGDNGVLNEWCLAFNFDTAVVPKLGVGGGLPPLSLLASSQGFVPTAIPDPGTLAPTLTVDPGTPTITDVRVFFDATHTWDGDLEIFIDSPMGTSVELSTGNGGSGDDYTSTIFDDAAATSITAGTAPFTGSFSPEGSLSDFDGESPVGIWILTVIDTLAPDPGTLNEWGLAFNGNTSEF